MPRFLKIITLTLALSVLPLTATFAVDEVEAPTPSVVPIPAQPLSERLAEPKELIEDNKGSYIDIIPAPSVTENQYPTAFDEPTHPAIRLTPDKSEIINLDSPVSTVIVGNPNHLAVMPSTSQGLILVGRQPGATHFIALNDNGELIMQRHVLVAAPQENYVRIRKTCAAAGKGDCQATQVYYCPDTCHQIIIGTDEKGGGGGSAAADAAQAGKQAPDESSEEAPPSDETNQ